jgi:hypothetical protein
MGEHEHQEQSDLERFYSLKKEILSTLESGSGDPPLRGQEDQRVAVIVKKGNHAIVLRSDGVWVGGNDNRIEDANVKNVVKDYIRLTDDNFGSQVQNLTNEIIKKRRALEDRGLSRNEIGVEIDSSIKIFYERLNNYLEDDETQSRFLGGLVNSMEETVKRLRT